MKKHVADELDQLKFIILWKIQGKVILDASPDFGRKERRCKDERIDCDQYENNGWKLFHNTSESRLIGCSLFHQFIMLCLYPPSALCRNKPEVESILILGNRL